MTIMELIAFFSPDIIRNHREKEKKRMEHKSNVFLEQEKISVLMRKFAIPCIISLLIAALYNIVDQIFIANATYLGSYGNAANNVVFPLTIVALAIAGQILTAFLAVWYLFHMKAVKPDISGQAASLVRLYSILSVRRQDL